MELRTYLNVLSFLQLFTFYAMFLTFTFTHVNGQDRQEYIVYMGDLNPTLDIPTPILHSSFLEKALHINSSESHISYSYKSIFNGFVAQLTNDEVHQISSMEEVVSVFPNGKNNMYTTRSWDFLNFPQTIRRKKEVESNIIVGVIDSGIWPELDSFSDRGMRSPPPKWKGSCDGLLDFKCNNKIIGGKYYKIDGVFSQYDIKSPRDTIGHGTHIASIIVGNLDSSANFYGLGEGVARGGVPSSRIAVYKVCWSDGISDTDITNAFEDAINDGVDIISISMGYKHATYLKDVISIGSFQAMKKGIMTICAAGNKGPRHRTVDNVSPWQLTVAASSTDREIMNYLKLGNRETLLGYSLNAFDQTNFSTLVYAGDVPNIEGSVLNIERSRYCKHKNSLDASLVRGKIVICDENNSGEAALSAGAIGMVILGQRNDTFKDSMLYALPTAYFYENESSILMRYFQTSRNQTASILKSHESFDRLAPYIASFSSRGPNHITPQILKPDLSAPGVRILAAWTPARSPSRLILDTRKLSYNIVSGTSIAVPHVAAAAAYVKSFHPSWSPSAIKSALITTALKMSVRTTPDAEFGYGAGQINPVSAINPGLVYDANITDYVLFLCGQNYNNRQLSRFANDTIDCTHYRSTDNSLNLNLPSFSIPIVRSNNYFNVSLRRKVTNVGLLDTYVAEVLTPPTFTIRVVPNTLSFTSVGQTKSFTLIVEGIMNQVKAVSASLSWVGDTNIVRSPIIIFDTNKYE